MENIPEGNYPLTVCMQNFRLIDDRIGGAPRYYLSPPDWIDMRVPEAVRGCVGFVGIREPDGTIRYGGTAFVVNVTEKSPDNPNREFRYFYLITAKHVADAIRGGDCVVRMNDEKERSVLYDAVNLRWWFHPTEADTVDVAVTTFAPPPSLRVYVQTVSDTMFATPAVIKQRGIGIGDEVYVAGLFTRITGTAKNQPVIRVGNIAMVPDEKIEFRGLGLIDAYVIEVRSIGGLSGCPVFVRPTVSTPLTDGPEVGKGKNLYGLGSFYFLGSMIGHWQIPEGFDPALSEAVNMGLSAIVPTYKIMEVINHPELIAMRKAVQEEDKRKKAEEAVLDTSFVNGKTQTIAKGLEIPIPTEDQFFKDLEKASRKKD